MKQYIMKRVAIPAGLWSLMALAMPALTTPAHAFPGAHGADRHRMADALNLSDEQRRQMKNIHRAARAEMLRLHDAMEDNREALRRLDPASPGYMRQVNRLAAEKGALVERMVKHRAKVRAAVAAILTPEQRQRAKQLHRDRRLRRDMHHGNAMRRKPRVEFGEIAPHGPPPGMEHEMGEKGGWR